MDNDSLARAKEKLNSEFLKRNEGTVWFCLTGRELVDGSGHYLIYGSELLQGVFGHDKLRTHGRPMLIECRVPTAAVEPDFLSCLAGVILKEIAEKYCLGRSERDTNFGFCIKETLEPCNILKFHYPKQVRDGIGGGVWRER